MFITTKIVKSNKNFFIYTCNTYEKEIFFYFFNLFVYQQNKLKKNCIIAFDLEYGTINIELMQILYDVETIETKIMFLITPKLLESEYIKTFFYKKIIANPKILKICNGAEAIDLKHIKTEILTDDNQFINFLYNYTDTKFICSYFNIKMDDKNKFCNVYELYKKTEVITNEFYNELKVIEEQYLQIKKNSNITTDVKYLNEMLFYYAIYDVILLIDSYKVYLNISKNDVYINKEMLFLSLYDKYFIDEFKNIKDIVNEANNNFIILNNETNIIKNKLSLQLNNNIKTITLITIYNIFINKYIDKYDKMDEFYKQIYCLYNVNFYKNYISTFIKFLLYLNIIKIYNLKNKNVFIKKNIKVDINNYININDNLELFLNKYNLVLIKEMLNILKLKIIKFIS